MKMPKPTEILHLKSQSQFIMDSGYCSYMIAKSYSQLPRYHSKAQDF